MNKESLYKISKMENKDKVILVKQGNFYKAFEEDAIILWSFFGYKVIEGKVSFPLSCFGRITSRLNRIGISIVVIKNEDDVHFYNSVHNNLYEKYKMESLNEYKIENKIEEVKKEVEYKIKEDISNYNKLIDFINSI